MVVALAQTRPTSGDVQKNTERHLEFITRATSRAADFIVFPELSLTAYEPVLAKQLAMVATDPSLIVFQKASDEHNVSIGVGFPQHTANGTTISLALFRPKARTEVYSKHFLHPDEDPWFIPGNNLDTLTINDTKIALAICYELSVKAHEEKSFSFRPDVYIASVAKFERGVKEAERTLAENAQNYSTLVMMCNSVGLQDGGLCTGTTSAWDASGKRIGQLDNSREGILFVDTKTMETKDFYFS